MKHVVTYSMGICSAFIAARLQETCQRPLCVFSDTKREDEDTYRFGREVAEKWGLEVVEASDGRDLWDYFRQTHAIPARQISSCSRLFKIAPFQAFLKAFPEPARVAFGYDLDEEDRADRTRAKWAFPEHEVWFPLIEWGVSKAECFGFFQQRGVAPPRIYRHYPHANCVPCKNYRRPDWVALQFHYPEKFAAALEFEATTGLRWMQDGPALAELPVLNATPSRAGRRKLVGAEPAFSFSGGCDACEVD